MKILIYSFLFFCLLGSVCQASEQIELRYNEQRPGGDYSRLNVRNVDECSQKCENDYRCRAFDFDTHEQLCWLKDRIPKSRHNRKVISGVKKGGKDGDQNVQREISGLLIDNNTMRYGGDYKTLSANNAKECARACARDLNCQSFNYGRAYGDCWLKHNVPEGVFSSNVVSGYKQRLSNNSEDDGWTTGEVLGLYLENNTQRRGGAYKKMTVKNARACVKLCAAENACQSFNYNKQSQECRLITSIPQGRHNTNITSGYKPKPRHPETGPIPSVFEVAGIRLENNIKRNGGDYRSFTVKNVKECARACANDKKCRAINYGKENRDCWLKKSVPKGVYNTTVISGVKSR